MLSPSTSRVFRCLIVLAIMGMFGAAPVTAHADPYRNGGNHDFHGGGNFGYGYNGRYNGYYRPGPLFLPSSYYDYYYAAPAYYYPSYPAAYVEPPPPPPETYVDNSSGSYCREFSQQINVDGQMQESYGTACLQPDGTWRVVPQ